MIELIPKHKTRTSPYYGSWNYCAQFYLPESHVLRKLDHAHIDHTIWVRKAWQNRNINFGGSWHHRSRVITDEITQNLHDICDFLMADPTPRKMVLNSDHIYIYANDVDLFERLARTGIISLVEITKVNLSGTPGNVVLKNPLHKLRTYFKDRRLDLNIADSVRYFLTNQSDIRLSPSLSHWIEQKWHMIQNHYFIDHDHESIIIMLKMIDPHLIRKTLNIEAAK